MASKEKIAAAKAFNATKWIAQNTLGGTEISAEATEVIASFTTMWNFFESTLCDNRASFAAFARVCTRFEPNKLTPASTQALDSCLAFWQFRYRTPQGFGPRFEALCFRPNDQRKHVEAVLKGDASDPQSKLLALMIIVYRLRNNLFHGLKTLDMLNDQVQNLTTASRCLAAVLEAIPSRFVLVPRQSTANS
jgi:hypothetical protein